MFNLIATDVPRGIAVMSAEVRDGPVREAIDNVAGEFVLNAWTVIYF